MNTIINVRVLFLLGSMLSTCQAQVYKSTISMAWSIYVPNPSFLSTKDQFILEKKTEEFVATKMTSSPLFRDQKLYMTTFDIRSQTINPDLVQSKFDAEITVLYDGKEKKDLSSVLATAIPNSEAEKLLQTLVTNGQFGASSTSSTVEYNDVDSVLVASASYGDKTLFIALLSLVSVLILTSFGVLISSTKCCRRKRVDNSTGIKHSSTMETTENSPRNSPANLGAEKIVIPKHEESAYAITPVRRGRNSQVSQTPVSQHSSLSEMISPASSTTSRNPLGIMRLSTLNKVTHQKPNEVVNTNTLYKIPLHESSDDEESAAGKV